MGPLITESGSAGGRYTVTLDELESMFMRVFARWREQGIHSFSAVQGSYYRSEQGRVFTHLLVEDLDPDTSSLGDLGDLIDFLVSYFAFSDDEMDSTSDLTLFGLSELLAGVAAGEIEVEWTDSGTAG
ncbi:hypothetical protein GCM10027070_22790 [Barrientosiimonas humi]